MLRANSAHHRLDLFIVFNIFKLRNDLLFHWLDVVQVAHHSIASAELAQVKRDALLDGTETVQGVQQLCLTLTRLDRH